ncbi:MAG: hypothetical protein AAF674_01490 [Pseudomonadota bacterium]
MRMKSLLAAAAIMLAPLAAEARGWTIIDLGTVATKEACQKVGLQLFERQGSTLQVDSAGRHIAAYGLRGLDIDGAIGCGVQSDGRTAVILTLHTWTFDSDLDATRLDLAREMEGIWDGLPK